MNDIEATVRLYEIFDTNNWHDNEVNRDVFNFFLFAFE